MATQHALRLEGPKGQAALASGAKLLYAQMREDPQVDREALAISPADRLLCVASGGCTALTLLAEGPAELVAVDLNPAQLALVELKIAALRALSVDQLRRFLGAWPTDRRLQLYRRVEPLLGAGARAYWSERRPLIEGGVLYAGATEALCRRWMPALLACIHPRRLYEALLDSPTLEAQRELYRQRWNSRRWRVALRMAFHPLLIRLVYGARFRERFGDGDLADVFARRLERGLTAFSARENYFLTQLLMGRYPPTAAGLPLYLQADVAARAREHAERLLAAGKLRLVHQRLDELLRCVPAGSFDKATLSNAVEWIPAAEVAPFFATLARAIAPGGRVVLRHMLATTELPAQGSWVESPRSERLTAAERAFLYERVSLYLRAGGAS
jgi:S-adenosylmethionine-diacylglycerol 3-amino-3-carboxypropyl transferase